MEEIINEQGMYTKDVHDVTRWHQKGECFTLRQVLGVHFQPRSDGSQDVTWGLVRIVYVAKWEAMQQCGWARQRLANQPVELESWQGGRSYGNVARKSGVQNKEDTRRFWQVLSAKTYTSRTLTFSLREMSMRFLAEWLSLHSYPSDLCRSIHATHLVIRICFQPEGMGKAAKLGQ